MKIVTAGLTKVLIIFSIVSCSHLKKESHNFIFIEKNKLIIEDKSLLNAIVVESNEDQLFLKQRDGRIFKIIKNEFDNNNSALKHLLARQVAISAIFRDLIEPYYGLVIKKKCTDLAEFSIDFKKDRKNSKYFTLSLPVDSFLNPFDCDKGLPTKHARYTFLWCESSSTVYEARDYKNLNDSFAQSNPISCSQDH